MTSGLCAKKKTLPHGLMVGGLGGGSGKSVVAVGMAAAFARRGSRVVPFKKGPDYIDAGWLQLAAGAPCYNLDPYLMPSAAITDSFCRHGRQADIIIVEGNRGLYDGVDLAGTYSTAELSLHLGLPVLLVVDCTKTTRTIAALVLGCQELDRRVAIRGVVLNRVGTARHERIVRQAVEHYTDVPVLGAVPRSKHDAFPQRHLGITPCPEHKGAEAAVQRLADQAEQCLDLERIQDIMAAVPCLAAEKQKTAGAGGKDAAVRIGIIKDAAFQFYYNENLEALQAAGATLIEVNALAEKELPELDGLYIGGGFPETSARELSANVSFRRSVKNCAEQGLPIYAECGGLIYLGERMAVEGQEFPLVGIFPVRFGLMKKPQAHGYTVLAASGANPFYPENTEIKGHEFRYSKVVDWQGDSSRLAFTMKRGVGFIDGRDGLVYKNVLALYTHIHAAGTPEWAPALVAKAAAYRRQRAGERG